MNKIYYQLSVGLKLLHLILFNKKTLWEKNPKVYTLTGQSPKGFVLFYIVYSHSGCGSASAGGPAWSWAITTRTDATASGLRSGNYIVVTSD